MIECKSRRSLCDSNWRNLTFRSNTVNGNVTYNNAGWYDTTMLTWALLIDFNTIFNWPFSLFVVIVVVVYVSPRTVSVSGVCAPCTNCIHAILFEQFSFAMSFGSYLSSDFARRREAHLNAIFMCCYICFLAISSRLIFIYSIGISRIYGY